MKAITPLLALAVLLIAPSPALADPYQLHHDYYKLINESQAPTGAVASNSVPWMSIGAGFALVGVAALLVALQLPRRPHRTAP